MNMFHHVGTDKVWSPHPRAAEEGNETVTPANDNRCGGVGANRVGVHVRPGVPGRVLLVGPGGDHAAMVTARTVAPSSGSCARISGLTFQGEAW